MIYGVLRGRPDRWVREEGDATPHLQIRILDDSGAPWRIAVNVQSDTGSEVAFWRPSPASPLRQGPRSPSSSTATACSSATRAAISSSAAPTASRADVVVYTADDAGPDDRYVRFHR